MHVGIIGCGEVGRCYAGALAAAGHEVVLCDANPPAGAVSLASEIDAPLFREPGVWLREIDVALSYVPGAVAMEAALACLSEMKSGALYADCTTSTPEHIRRAASQFAAAKVDFVDVAILGAIAVGGIRTPLVCAGSGAAGLCRLMEGIGAPCRIIEGGVGDASALKLLRSSFTKGLEAVTIDFLLIAEQLGLRSEIDRLFQDLDSMSVRGLMKFYTQSHLRHAERRLQEIDEIRDQFGASGIDVEFLNTARARFVRTCERVRRAGDVAGQEDAIAFLSRALPNDPGSSNPADASGERERK